MSKKINQFLLCLIILYLFLWILFLIWPSHPLNHPIYLVIPFVSKQLPLVFVSLSHWNTHLPCDSNKKNHLVFYLDGTYSSILQKVIQHFWKNQNEKVKKCFYPPFFLQTNHDLGYPDGPCESFFHLALNLSLNYFPHSTWIWMEPDVVPIQSGWMESFQPNCNYWMQGSFPECKEGLHLNGNSVYCFDDDFRQYILRMRQHYVIKSKSPGCVIQTSNQSKVGFDQILYDYLQYEPQYQNKFHSIDWIQNYCDRVYNSSQISSNTFLIHSKSIFFTFEESIIVKHFDFLFQRKPTHRENLKWKLRLLLQEETNQSLISAICFPSSHHSKKIDTNSICPSISYLPKIKKTKSILFVDTHPIYLLCHTDIFKSLVNVSIHVKIHHKVCDEYGWCENDLDRNEVDVLVVSASMIKRFNWQFFYNSSVKNQKKKLIFTFTNHDLENIDLLKGLSFIHVDLLTDDLLLARQIYLHTNIHPRMISSWCGNVPSLSSSPSFFQFDFPYFPSQPYYHLIGGDLTIEKILDENQIAFKKGVSLLQGKGVIFGNHSKFEFLYYYRLNIPLFVPSTSGSYFRFPFVQVYHSKIDLVQQILKINSDLHFFLLISKKMMLFNQQHKEILTRDWQKVFST